MFAAVGVLAAPAGSYHQTLRSCSGFRTASLKVSRLRTNYTCTGARRDLRRLLHNGVRGLPKTTTRRGRWGCAKAGADRICTKYTAGGAIRRVLFRAARRKTSAGAVPNAGQPPAPVPTPTPVSAVQDCINRWNADSYDVNVVGKHFYPDPSQGGHGVRRGWVFTLAGQPSRCAVIFVVPPSDYEYGSDGAVFDENGTVYMDDPSLTSEPSWNPLQLQNQAPIYSNVALGPDGRLSPAS
jgi:hypothetical protein